MRPSVLFARSVKKGVGVRGRRVVWSVLAALCLVVVGCSSDGGSDEVTTGEEGSDQATDTSNAPETSVAPSGEGAGGGEDVQVGMVYDLGGRGDQSFNDAAAAGLDRAKQEFGIEAEELEPDEGGENREELMRLLAEQGYGLVFGVGFLFTDAVTAAAPDFPETTFGQIDSVVEEPNVASLVFAEQEGSFLVGAAAALASKTDKLGFIGGVEQDLIKRFEAGFVAGAKQVKPDVQVDVKYLTQPPDFSGFNDPARGRETALGQYQGGADVIYHAAGGSGGGLFQAAKEVSDSTGSKVWAIGVDSDQYNVVDDPLKPYVLTSMLKKVDVAVYDTIRRVVNEGEASGLTTYDLEAGGVDYSTTGGFVDQYRTQLEDLKRQIIDGQISVPSTPAG